MITGCHNLPLEKTKPNRLVFFADEPKKPDKAKESAEDKAHKTDVLSEEAIRKACEGSTIPQNTLKGGEGGDTFKNWMLKASKRGGVYQKICREFVMNSRRRKERREGLHRRYFDEVSNLASDNRPWSELTKKRLEDADYDKTVDTALDLQKLKGANAKPGKHLVMALVKGHISIDNFLKWAQILLAGPAQNEKQEVLAKKLGQFTYLASDFTEREISVELTLLGVSKDDDEKVGETKAKGLKGVKEQVREVLSQKETPQRPEHKEAVKREYLEAAKQLKAKAGQRNDLEQGLLAFMTKEMEFHIEDKPAEIKSFLTKNKKGDADYKNAGARQEAFSDILIERMLEASRKPSAPDTDALFNHEYAKFVEDAAKTGTGLKIEIPQASKDKVLKEMRKIIEIDKECGKYVEIAQKAHQEHRTLTEKQRGELIASRVDTNNFGIKMPVMIDENGHYKDTVQMDGRFITTVNGQSFPVKLEVVSEPQTADGIEDRTEHELKAADPKEIRHLKYRVTGRDYNGEPYDRVFTAAGFLEYGKVHNLRRDFSLENEKSPVEQAQEVLDEHDVRLELSTYSKFVRVENQRQKDGSIKTTYPAYTIAQIGPKGEIVLDKDIELFAPSSFKKTTAKEDKNPHKRPAGKPIQLGEFISWVLRSNQIYQDIEETPETSTEELSLINKRLKERHAKEKDEAQKDGFILPQRAAQIGDIVQSRANGALYSLQRDPQNFNKIQVIPLNWEKPKLYSLPETGAQAMAQKAQRKLVAGIPRGMDIAQLEDFAHRNDLELYEPETAAKRAISGFDKQDQEAVLSADEAGEDLKTATGAPAVAAGAAAGTLAKTAYSTAKQQAQDTKKQAQDAIDKLMADIRVGKGDTGQRMAALQKQYDADIQSAPTESVAPPTSEEQEVQKIVERARKSGAGEESMVTPGALPELYDKNIKVEYAPDSLLRRMWRETTILSNNDVWEMGKAMYEYYNRRWQRNVKNRYSTVGQHVPWFGTEMGRINQAAEDEEVNQFKEAMADWGIWQIEDELYKAGNKDKIKACLITLAEKGQIKWADTRLWKALNKFTDSKYHIHIPVNGDPQVKDPRTGKTGIEMIGPAIDSLWGEGQYNDWYTQNASTYDSNLKKYNEEGKQLESDPYNNGSVTGRLKQLLAMHKQDYYVDPQEYEGLIHFIIDAGKSDVANKLYFIVHGLATKNSRGQTLLSMDRAGSIDGVYLNRLPWLDFIVKRNVKRANGDTTGWQLADMEVWAKKFDEGCPPGFENSADKNPAVWKFLWETVLNDDKTIIRTNKGMRNAEQMDHDDAHFLIPLVSEKVIDDVLKGPTGSKKYFTYEGYNNAFPGYSELLKNRAILEPPRVGLLYDTIKSFVRYDSIMDNRLYRSEGPRFARMDPSLLRRASVVSAIPSGVHIAQMREAIKRICYAYGYHEIDTVFNRLPEREEYKDQQTRVEEEIKNFGSTFENLIRSDGGKTMVNVLHDYIGAGGITGLDPNVTAEQKEQGMEAAREGGAEEGGDLAQF